MINETQTPGITITIAATEALKQNFFVGADGKHSAAGKVPVGVCQLDMDAGQPAPVAINGVLLVVAGGPIAVGDDVTTGANGTAVKDTGGNRFGLALTAAVKDELVKVVLK